MARRKVGKTPTELVVPVSKSDDFVSHARPWKTLSFFLCGVETDRLPIGDIYNGGTSMKRKLRAPAR